MGLCLGSEITEEGKKARLHSAEIDRELYEHARREMNVVKVLLLVIGKNIGTPIPLPWLLMTSRSQADWCQFRPSADGFEKVHAHSVLSCGRCFDEEQVLFPFISHALSCLWADQGVRSAAARGYEYELNDSALYFFFFDNMDRIVSLDYVPTETDVLRVRIRTTGVIETQFKVKHLVFRLYDVGGQRTERRKWISCFEDVRAVVFVVALSGYDMTLVEDSSMNRLQESLRLFNNPSICNNGADCDVDSAARFIASMFVSQNVTPRKLIYHHFTTATDTSNVQVVFQVVMDTIMKENLEAVSLL
ncbi:Guanine nucleotide-binding protein G(o) subunit alpha [Bagarius yarrelli]|uniref:Guanine nucleotide-binding protein G(O) subunit alpha n=1 Tax=Bagarius yarrelli TaxID=175774 RepID=A0A556VX00_BAGYA|nr:Guanine nucleotide-binding protein G(o) subunit alpha [Bagarius yarrelli]